MGYVLVKEKSELVNETIELNNVKNELTQQVNFIYEKSKTKN